MNRPSTGDIVVVGTRGTVDGKTNHGGYHALHLIEMGIPVVAVDTKPVTAEVDGLITHFRGTIQDYLRSGVSTPKGVLISTPDEFHMPDLTTCIEAGVGNILAEKPIAIDRAGWERFLQLREVARKNGQTIMSCLPRILDDPYQKLVSIISKLRELYGNIRSIDHKFGFHKETNLGNAGRDHLAHEITAILKILGFKGKIEDIIINIDHSSSDKYSCSGEINGIKFTVSGDKKSKKKYEGVLVEFSNGVATLDADNGILAHGPKGGDWVKEDGVNKSNPVARLQRVSENFALKALGEGVELYLPNNLLMASAFFPATLPWPNQQSAS